MAQFLKENFISLIIIVLGFAFKTIYDFLMKKTVKRVRIANANTRYNGYDIAKKVLDYFDVQDYKIAKTENGQMDSFNFVDKTVYISMPSYEKKTLDILASAAHKAGLAVESYKKRGLFYIINLLIWIVRISSIVSVFALVISLFIKKYFVVKVCLIVFALSIVMFIFGYISDSIACNYVKEFVNNSVFLTESETKTLFELLDLIKCSYISMVFQPVTFLFIGVFAVISKFIQLLTGRKL